MKAAQINSYGDASVMQINEIEKPTVTDGKVGVEVHAASLNPFDSSVRSGYMQKNIPLQLPVTLGGDIAGVVVEIGEGVTNVAVGDKVYGQANVVAGNSGAFAEYAVTSANQVTKLPKNLDYNQAASLPLVGVSALQAVKQHIDLQSNQKIFIHGGAGGIGSLAIQIAKHIGAYVATTASGNDIDYVKQLGADEVIDYKSQDFSELLNGYDAAFDTTPGNEVNKILTILKQGGIVVSMLAHADEAEATKLDVKAVTQSTKVTTGALDELTQLVESEAVVPNIGKVFKLAEIKEAFIARESGTVRGKIVLEIQ
jgi:NADPH:quinone reductase-like Zn-dependent oxidoreductase